MEPRFIGPSHQPLFGVYHRPRGNPQGPSRAVVVCPPIGQEYVRSHWCLRLTASQLARAGMHVLRFDYRGIGDSWGTLEDVASTEDWLEDLRAAVDHLKEQADTGAVMLLGLRTGATLAAELAVRSSDIHSLLLWEPVSRGAAMVKMFRRMHAEMLDLWVCKMETENSDDIEELLGSRYRRELINHLNEQQLPWEALFQPHVVFDRKPALNAIPADKNSMRKTVAVQGECAWSELRQLETAWLRPQTGREVVRWASETFERLQRFGILADDSLLMM